MSKSPGGRLAVGVVGGLLALSACSSSPAASAKHAPPTLPLSATPSASSPGFQPAPAAGTPGPEKTTSVVATAGTTLPPNSSDGVGHALGSGQNPAGLLLVAALHHNRLLGLDSDQLLANRSPHVSEPWVSPTFGAAIAVAATSKAVYAVSSNTPDLVRIDWHTNRITSVNALPPGASGRPTFGSLYLLDGLVYVSYALGNTDRVSVFDATTLDQRRSASFDDPLADYSQSCPLDNRHIALVESGAVRILDATGLVSEARTVLGPSPYAVACSAGHAYVTNFDHPTGTELDLHGHVIGHFGWQGHGSAVVTIDTAHDQLLGTDDTARVLFACPLQTLRCRQTAPLGAKPTSVAAVRDTAVVDLEGDAQVVVVDLATLKVDRRLDFDDQPRIVTPVG